MENMNKLTLVGTVKEPFVEKRMGKRGNLMVSKIDTARLSGVKDEVVVAVPAGLLEDRDYVGEKILLEGKFVSHNERKDDTEKRKTRLVLYALAEVFYVTDEWIEDRNDLELQGFLCRDPKFREKESGYKITDILVAQNEENGAANYIPCICWSGQALFTRHLSVGTMIHVKGRVQSRHFLRNSGVETVDAVAYENSVWRVISIAEAGKTELSQESPKEAEGNEGNVA